MNVYVLHCNAKIWWCRQFSVLVVACHIAIFVAAAAAAAAAVGEVARVRQEQVHAPRKAATMTRTNAAVHTITKS